MPSARLRRDAFGRIKAVLVVADAAGGVVLEFPLVEVLAAEPPPRPAGTINEARPAQGIRRAS